MKIQRYTANGGYTFDGVGAFVRYSEVAHELERLNDLVESYQKTDAKITKSIPTKDSSYIVRYDTLSEDGYPREITLYTYYDNITKLLEGLSKQTNIFNVKVYALTEMNVEQQIKFEIKLPE